VLNWLRYCCEPVPVLTCCYVAVIVVGLLQGGWEWSCGEYGPGRVLYSGSRAAGHVGAVLCQLLADRQSLRPHAVIITVVWPSYLLPNDTDSPLKSFIHSFIHLLISVSLHLCILLLYISSSFLSVDFIQIILLSYRYVSLIAMSATCIHLWGTLHVLLKNSIINVKWGATWWIGLKFNRLMLKIVYKI